MTQRKKLFTGLLLCYRAADGESQEWITSIGATRHGAYYVVRSDGSFMFLSPRDFLWTMWQIREDGV